MTFHVETRIQYTEFQEDFDWQETPWSYSVQPILEPEVAYRIAAKMDQTYNVRVINSKGEVLIDNLDN